MKPRYEKNVGVIDEQTMKILMNQTILVAGLGGLGGHVAEGLVRLGVSKILLVDVDRYETSNLNRQVFCDEAAIGQFKVDVVKERLKQINPELFVQGIKADVLSLESSIYAGVDVMVDALDDIPSKLQLESLADQHQKVLLHGAIGGWYGQVGVIEPGYHVLKTIYGDAKEGLEKTYLNPTFTPGIIAYIMLAEMVKYWMGDKHCVLNDVLWIDVHNHVYERFGLRGDNDGSR